MHKVRGMSVAKAHTLALGAVRVGHQGTSEKHACNASAWNVPLQSYRKFGRNILYEIIAKKCPLAQFAALTKQRILSLPRSISNA